MGCIHYTCPFQLTEVINIVNAQRCPGFRSYKRHQSAIAAETRVIRISCSCGLGCLNALTCQTPPTEADLASRPERLVFERRNSRIPCYLCQIGLAGRVNWCTSPCQRPTVLTSYSFDGPGEEHPAVEVKGGRCDMSNQVIRRQTV